METEQERFWDLVTRRLTKEANLQERAELDTFLEEEKYQQMFTWMEQQWKMYPQELIGPYDTEAELRHLYQRIQQESNIIPLYSNEKPVRSSNPNRWLQIAAMILVFISIGAALWWSSMPEKQFEGDVATTKSLTYKVGHGQKARQFILPDSSVVWLNAESRLEIVEGYMDFHRKVLLEGEAFFQVTHNSGKPFIVSTGEIETRVLGTQFNISAYQDESLVVTVESGKVQVSNQGKEKVELNPNDQVQISKSSKDWTRVKVDAAKYMSWREDLLWFDNDSLKNITPRLERRFGYRFQFDDSQTGDCILGGKIQVVEISKLLFSLKMIYKIDYEYDTSKKVVYLKGGKCN